MMTQGNDANPSAQNKKLTWITAETLMGYYMAPTGGTALMYDWTRDTHLRAAARSGNTLFFSPLADGIVNVDLKDVDDYVYLRGAMGYALGQTATWPPGLP